ncbi:MAG: riboflavin synthase [Phycisphaerae bacterium]
MFSGIVETIGEVVAIHRPDARAPGGGAVRLVVAVRSLREPPKLGASIAMNGVCLTVCSADLPELAFDVVPETLQRTNLGALQIGDRVNVEQSLRLGDRVDGHFVQGHVEGVVRIASIEQRDSDYRIWFVAPAALMKYMVPKGSISLDGVSLTIAQIDGDRCAVALIPTTLRETTLGARRANDILNVETDVFARTIVDRVEQVLAAKATGERLVIDAFVRECAS